MRRARIWLPAAIAAVLVVSACTTPAPSGPTASPTASPTYTCTAAPSAQCTAEKAAEEKQQALDYAAAEKAYRAFTAERNRLIKARGATSATPMMKKYAGGPYLKEITGFLKSQKSKKLRGTSGLKILEIQPSPGSRRTDSPSSELTLTYCEDGRNNKLTDASGRVVGSGRLVGGSLYARQVAGEWIIWDDKGAVVSTCPN